MVSPRRPDRTGKTLTSTMSAGATSAAAPHPPEGDAPLAWVRERNAHALQAIGEPLEKRLYSRLLKILDSSEKIPYIGRVLNGLYYNFWEDETHVRGIWRRCTLCLAR